MNISFKSSCIRCTLLFVLVFTIVLCRLVPHCGELYAIHAYPLISSFLSFCACPLPYSLSEWISVGLLLLLFVLPIFLHKKSFRYILFTEFEIVLWIVVWFYLGWGMNYFRESFYDRAEISKSEVDKAEFCTFLHAYTDSLNASYIAFSEIDTQKVEKEIKDGYNNLYHDFGLTKPKSWQHPKLLTFNDLYNSVGVLGYMGPFTCESQLNNDLPPVQYPSVYAHELAHLLSVSSEAEATFWAYVICTNSNDAKTKCSGYLSIFPNVIRNARSILNRQEFDTWKSTVSPDVIKQRELLRNYWNTKYNETIGNVQDVMFNALLKTNKIHEGTKNYDGVVNMIISSRNIRFFAQ